MSVFRRSVASALLLLAAGALVTSTRAAQNIDPKRGCRSNPAVIGRCFRVRGRIFVSNGTPSVRIQPDGTKRLLGVLPPEQEIEPACLKEAVTWGTDVFGEFTVCPFTAARAGAMQNVCVAVVNNPVAHTVEGHDRPITTRTIGPCNPVD
jgi:hypothetical protein